MQDQEKGVTENGVTEEGVIPPDGGKGVKELMALCEENMAGWKRALADYDNLKKDLSRERSDIRRMAVESAVEGFMPVLEHFDAAVQFVPDFQGKEKNWAQGVLHIRRELEDAMKSLGVESFGEAGETFDPLKHEAVGNRAEEGKKEGTIVEVASRGWKLADRILRPARVIITS